ncbi:isoleucine--tRNA ligase [Candidatus Falkowbacteria bacterium]|nr:isoleucine--tRNA ligase [Candidatus Falkowbacteria bacterium]
MSHDNVGGDKKNFPAMENEIAKFWKEKNIFKKSIDQRDGSPDFVFYDGPPFATGLPHHGHILASTSKDLIGRYKTMRGYHVLRRWGWDCHGLPVENLIEKELEISGRKEIEAYGIGKFNDACEASVLRYDKEWRTTIDRIGRFVDFDDQYKTMDDSFMESVWWGFSQLVKKDLVYEDTRISLYCPRCETPLSNSEIAMDNSYKSVSDPSIYVAFKLKDSDEHLLIWTTTPWTLPANAAIAVNPEITYALVESEGKKLWLAQDRVEALSKDLKTTEVLATKMGSELVGLSYEPIFGYMKATHDKTHTVVAGDFVTTQDGSGMVHIAPTFVEDDYKVGKQYGLDFFETVDSQGKFLEMITDFAGKNVWEVNRDVLKHLKSMGVVVALKEITHEYPFCWRCDTKLIYKTQKAWYVAVTKIKNELLETNKQIHWYPAHLQEGRFGKGLETAPDWNISRSRFWGNPIPVWKNDVTGEIFVPESIADLEKVSGMKVKSMHRPGIDEVVWSDGKGTFTRTPEVFDCWFESGSMPWASVHYPFENKEFFEKNYPSQFITEYIAQTRGWFYNMHVLAIAIFGKPSFTHAVTTGTILAENGQKMSKSKKNFTPPEELFEKYGVDSMRFYLMSSPLMKGENLRYADKEQADAFRKIIMLSWNVYSFYELYRNVVKHEASTKSQHLLDVWIISKTQALVRDVTQKLDAYDITTATRLIGEYINELSTWYIRRSRDRFKDDGSSSDLIDVLSTTRYALLTLVKVMAPVTPFIAEDMYLRLGDEKESVHLCDWPTYDESLISQTSLTHMDTAKESIEKALAIRAKNQRKVRQALSTLYITTTSLPQAYFDIIADEVNVKEVMLVESLPHGEFIVTSNEEKPTVALNIEITPQLQIEGDVRELVRMINAYRKELGLTPTDMITLGIATSDLLWEYIMLHKEHILASNKLTDLVRVQEGDHFIEVNEHEASLVVVK